MKISASVFSNKQRPLEALVQEIESCSIDYIHVDCNDDLSVGAAIARIRKVSQLPIDLHIISSEPEKFYPMIQEHQVEMVTLQYEDLQGRQPELPDLGCSWGLSVVTDTPFSCFESFAGQCDFILFMTTVPGQSGGAFDKANFRKIRQFRRHYPDKRIHVDGGVNAEISFALRSMGVHCAVSGSFLVKAESLAHAFLNLLVQKGKNQLRVGDFMTELEELPVLRKPDISHSLSLEKALQVTEDYRMGYCLLVDEKGKLAGLISNADVRRGLLAHISDLQALDISDMINATPKFIHKDATASEMLKFVKRFPFLISYLPVVDDSHRLVGAVNFNNLILGEL
ncbi:MAG TPA: CBS domain-containing protein [Bacteroidetes bacterium]|nr:CBS domain-containing protein [Bacteroidota bacterium]